MKQIRLNKKQSDFVQSKKRYCFLGGGVGSGKTLAGILKSFNALQEHPGTCGLIGRLNMKQLKESTRKEFYKLVPKEVIASQNDTEGTCRFKNGSEVLFWSVEDSAKKRVAQLKNIELGFFWLDQAEEIPQKTFLELKGRLRHPLGPGQGWLTYNMNGQDWIYHEVEEPIERGAPVEEYFFAQTSSFDNAAYLPPEYLKDLLRMPDYWFRRYVLGERNEFSGLVWSNYSDEKHLIPPIDLTGWRHFAAVDHGRSAPTVVLFGATNGEVIVIYDVYYQIGGVVAQHVFGETLGGQIVRDGLKAVEMGAIDGQAFAKDQEKEHQEWSVQQEWYAQSDVWLVRAAKNRMRGIELVWRLLAEDEFVKHPVSGKLGAPRLYFYQSVAEPIRSEIKQWKLKEGTFSGSTYVPSDETETKGRDDAMDALRYLCMLIAAYLNIDLTRADYERAAKSRSEVRARRRRHPDDEDERGAGSWMGA